MPPRHRSTVHLDVDPSTHAAPPPERRERRASVLLLGDFSGRGAAGSAGPPTPMPVDRDTVDAVLAAVAPHVSLGDGAAVAFRELDDFHPDVLLRRVPALGAAMEGRSGGAGSTPSGETAGGAPTPPAPAPPAGGVLDAILDQAGPGPAGPPPAPASDAPLDSIRAFAAEVARFDAVAADDGTDREAHASRAAHALRAFLRVPVFRNLERRWRAVDFIVRRLDTGPRLHLYLADLSRAALAAEAEAAGGLEASALARMLKAGAGPDGDPWTYVALLDGAVGPGAPDQVLLAWTTALCAAFGATLLVDGDPALAGIADLGDFDEPSAWGGVDPGWSAFRTAPEARSVGVAAPGFLLRVPYGPDTADVEELPSFREVEGAPRRDDYLMGPAAAAAVVALTRAYLSPDDGRPPDLSVTGVPLHAWSAGVDRGVTAGAAAMTDGAARRLLEAGLIPVAWSRGEDRVRLLVPRTAGGASLP